MLLGLVALIAADGCSRRAAPVISADPFDSAVSACGDTRANVDHCGRCGHACNGGACEKGECVARVVSEPMRFTATLHAGAGRLYVERGCGRRCSEVYALDPATKREELTG